MMSHRSRTFRDVRKSLKSRRTMFHPKRKYYKQVETQKEIGESLEKFKEKVSDFRYTIYTWGIPLIPGMWVLWLIYCSNEMDKEEERQKRERKRKKEQEEQVKKHPPTSWTTMFEDDAPSKNQKKNPWTTLYDEESDRYYYWNRDTGETTWEKPD